MQNIVRYAKALSYSKYTSELLDAVAQVLQLEGSTAAGSPHNILSGSLISHLALTVRTRLYTCSTVVELKADHQPFDISPPPAVPFDRSRAPDRKPKHNACADLLLAAVSPAERPLTSAVSRPGLRSALLSHSAHVKVPLLHRRCRHSFQKPQSTSGPSRGAH